MRVLVIGATGLVGRQAVERLAEAGHELCILARRSAGRGGGEIVAPPEQWPALVRSRTGDVAVCAIGTTMRAAGSEAAFRAVDFDIAVDFARAACASGFRQMIVISSVGADSGSRNFYLRTKGEMEKAVSALGFDRVDLIRPGLLRGERGPERRPGERLGIILSPLVNLFLRGRLDRYAAVDSKVVALAVAKLAGLGGSGTFIHRNRDIRRLADG